MPENIERTICFPFLTGNVYGFTYSSSRGRAYIVVNDDLSPKAKQLTCLHEVYHAERLNEKPSLQQEHNADCFARERLAKYAE